MTKSPPSPAVQDYLKAIYKLERQGGKVSTAKVAERLGASPAAVSKMLKSLSQAGLAHHRPYMGVRLTARGEAVALEVIRHHRLLELYLHDVLGYAWDEVHEEAERLEHHISEEFEARIDRLLNYPTSDPHGSPIPTSDGHVAPPPGTPLADAEPGDCLVVRRVRDDDAEMLRFLASLGLRLGTVLRVVDKQPFNGPLTLEVGKKHIALGREPASQVYVEASDGG